MLKMIDLTWALQIWTRIGGVAECFFADRTISRDEGLRAYRIASIGRICRILSLVILASAPVAANDGLRIETEVFVPEQVQPISHNLTLIRSATVYDFLLNDPLEVAVFDRERGQFSILQVKQKTKTTFDSQELLQRMDRMRVLARSSGPLIQFSAYPEFDYQFDDARSRMSFTSPLVKYVLDVMRPDNVDMVHRYRDFSDWYAMLNALRPGMRPPHARMEDGQQTSPWRSGNLSPKVDGSCFWIHTRTLRVKNPLKHECESVSWLLPTLTLNWCSRYHAVAVRAATCGTRHGKSSPWA